MLSAKGREGFRLETAGCLKAAKGRVQKPSPLGERILAIRDKRRSLKPAALDQVFKTDEKRVSGVGRKALVGRPIAMRRIDRKGLPDRHAGRDQVLHKTVG